MRRDAPDRHGTTGAVGNEEELRRERGLTALRELLSDDLIFRGLAWSSLAYLAAQLAHLSPEARRAVLRRYLRLIRRSTHRGNTAARTATARGHYVDTATDAVAFGLLMLALRLHQIVLSASCNTTGPIRDRVRITASLNERMFEHR